MISKIQRVIKKIPVISGLQEYLYTHLYVRFKERYSIKFLREICSIIINVGDGTDMVVGHGIALFTARNQKIKDQDIDIDISEKYITDELWNKFKEANIKIHRIYYYGGRPCLYKMKYKWLIFDLFVFLEVDGTTKCITNYGKPQSTEVSDGIATVHGLNALITDVQKLDKEIVDYQDFKIPLPKSMTQYLIKMFGYDWEKEIKNYDSKNPSTGVVYKLEENILTMKSFE